MSNPSLIPAHSFKNDRLVVRLQGGREKSNIVSRVSSIPGVALGGVMIVEGYLQVNICPALRSECAVTVQAVLAEVKRPLRVQIRKQKRVKTTVAA